MADFSSMLTWRDQNAPNLGPGLSRPLAGAKTNIYKARLTLAAGGAPMVVTFRAESSAKARQYMAARWPGSTVVALERNSK